MSKCWLAGGIVAVLIAAPGHAGELAPDQDDRLWLHRNLGSAYWANEDLDLAADELGSALELAPESAADAFNAGAAALRAGRPDDARADLDRAAALDPNSAPLHYAIGLLAKRNGDLAAAKQELLRCRELGGDGPELEYNLGIVASRTQDLDAAIAEFGRAVERGALDAPRHYASALYRYGRTLLQAGQREKGAAALKEYQELVKQGAGAQLSEEDLEVGALLELAHLPRPADVRAAGPVPAFAPESLPVTSDLRWAEVADVDADGDTDLLVGDGQTVRDLRRDGARWVDVTESRGLAGLLGVTSARVLDVDNDGERDLVRGGGNGVQFHPGQQGSWSPPRPVLSGSVVQFRPVDFDHEGDVDFVAAALSGVVLARNNGDSTFEDVTPGSGLEAIGPSTDVEVGDLDDDLDVDLLFVTRRGAVVVASSLRGGRFEIRPALDAPESVFDAALGDLDSDGDLDVAVASAAGVTVLENRGDLSFVRSGELAIEGAVRWPPSGGTSLWLADFDNDGRLDVLAGQEGGATLALNQGELTFLQTRDPLRPVNEARAVPVAVGLVDDDVRLDLVTSLAKTGIARNAGQVGRGIALRPMGTKNNHDGVGATFELLAGARYGRADADGHLVHFGLGRSGRIDAIRVRWPNGIHQGVTDAKAGTRLTVEEKAGLVGSCPFLYAWNGGKFEYITDILTVTPLGLPMMPGMYVPPNWDEVIRVTSDQLQPDTDGMLTVQVTEELREVTYLDQVKLYAIDTPSGTEVQPNERFKFPPFPEFGIHVLQGARAPVRATDSRGRDVAEALEFTDDIVVGDLPLTHYQGITQGHWIELDFGDVPPDAKLTLHLAGWFYWTNASINLAIAQDARYDFVPPQL
ncbi:MAG: VCBS repeat-containing protein, partial [Gemmatimonadetes bacterium]|nr:VCBS repeat-containing protein [Gemmatimonadota bacterium]